MNLAEVVADAIDFEPVPLGVDHAPPSEVVDGGSPQHGFLAACVHGDVATDTGSIDGSGVNRKHETRTLGRFCDALGNHTCFGVDGRNQSLVTFAESRQGHMLDLGDSLELLGIEDSRQWRERDGAAGVTSAAPSWDDAETELDTGSNQPGNFVFRIGAQHDEGVLDAPVGCVGHVRYPREGVESDGILTGVFAE